jgi:CRP-like cAMP-binding protein
VTRHAATNEELLERSPLWLAFPPAARRELAARATRRTFRAGQRLLGAGDRSVITLVVGRAELVSLDPMDVEPVAIRSVVPPATIGISVALGAPPSAELWAREAGSLISLPGDAVAATVKRHPDAAIAALIHLANVISDLSSALEVMRRHSLADRLRHVLADLSQGRRELVITHAQLAGVIGGTRPNVSRALARLEADGLIRRHKGRIELR